MNLSNKVVVIIGGSRGFGEQLAKSFIKEGAKVVIASKSEDMIVSTAKAIGAIPFVVDVRSEPEIRNLALKVTEQLGAIDIWINCAGVFKIFPKDELIDMNRAHEMFDINFFGVVFGSRAALLYMQEKGGVIISIISSAALDATRSKNAKLYAASKWAVRGYVEALRGENTNSNIQIYSVYPGGMKTHLHDEALPADFDNFMEPSIVADKVLDNLKKEVPEQDLIIKRPIVH
ncbi:MAG: SDR family NAD(P)-dependent oxidoreductase [Patescibacteria group bacterium]